MNQFLTQNWSPQNILHLFLMLKLIQHILESSLSRLNARYWSDTQRQEMARTELGISSEDMNKSAAYSAVRYKFSRIRNSFTFLCFILFIGMKGIYYCEQYARTWGQKILGLNSGSEEIAVGILFFAILMIGSQALSLPFSLYNTFVIEERFGFNKQTISGYLADLAKATLLGVVIGVPLLGTILWIMGATGDLWWVWAWLFISIFSIITSWLYPTLLAPLFNKFRPLEDGELKEKINSLASKIGFSTDGIFVMDASKRSAHGNAYFTGIFGKKRIVLFDTLLADMSAQEVTAVLAHELGHFKLHHVRQGLIRGLLMSLATFYLMSLVLNHGIFYEAFGLETITHHAGLVLFTLWFSSVEFFIQPLETWISRRNEFAADQFAKDNLGESGSMISALKKLREKSFVMPISHPIFSSIYHSHPPMLERLRALSKI